MKNKKIIWILVAVAVVIFIVYVSGTDKISAPTISKSDIPSFLAPITKNSTGTTEKVAVKALEPSSPSAVSGVYIISYTNSGFKPNLLEIKRGTVIKFVNDSTRAMRVSESTNNPATQSLNQSKTVGRGGIYEYTFNDVGTYNYANMNNSADKGTVVVR